MSNWNRSWSFPWVIATTDPSGESARFNGILSESLKCTSSRSVPDATLCAQTEFKVGSRSWGPVPANESGRKTTLPPSGETSGNDASLNVNDCNPVEASNPNASEPLPLVRSAIPTSVPPPIEKYGPSPSNVWATAPPVVAGAGRVGPPPAASGSGGGGGGRRGWGAGRARRRPPPPRRRPGPGGGRRGAAPPAPTPPPPPSRGGGRGTARGSGMPATSGTAACASPNISPNSSPPPPNRISAQVGVAAPPAASGT